MAHSGVDIVSVDWTVDMAVARQRLGANMGVQGISRVLFGDKAFIRSRIRHRPKSREPGTYPKSRSWGFTKLRKKMLLSFETVKQLNYSKEAELDETCLQPQDC